MVRTWDIILATLDKGGSILVIIFLLTVWAWFLLLRRQQELARERLDYNAVLDRVFASLENGNEYEAIRYLESLPSRFTAFVKGLISWEDRSRIGLAFRQEELLLHAARELRRHQATISVLATIAPLLGLLGTVTGMVATFEVIHLFGSSNPMLMADGISESLITTQAGLVAAFPILLFVSWQKSRVNTLMMAMEKASLRLSNFYQSRENNY